MLRKLLGCLAFVWACTGFLEAATLQFSARQDIATPAQHLVGLTIADFNGDGHPDLVVSDTYDPSRLYVYLNDGTGHFGAPLVTKVNTNGADGINALLSGDVNEDGKQDLIVSTIAGPQSDIVMLGNGDGTFTQGQTLPTSFGFITAKLIDINGDKHLDLVSGANVALNVFLGDGKGGFQPVPVGFQPTGFVTGLTVADFNGDGHLDFVSGSYSDLKLLSFLGVGDGTFRSPLNVGSGPFGSYGYSLDSADFNGDGKPDVLLGEPDAAFVMPGNGDGSFQTANGQLLGLNLPAGTLSNPQAEIVLVAAADLNGDGIPDAVAADDNVYILSAFLNDGKGLFSSTPDFQAALDPGSGVLQVADLNGDGLPDIVLTNYKTQKISIFLSVVPKVTPSVNLQSSAAQALVGASITVTVQVKGSGAKVPTGTVALTSGTTSYGQQTLDTSGQATFSLSDLSTGQYSLTAAYSGDKYNNASTNTAAFVESITDFAISAPNPSQTVSVNSAASYNIAVAPTAGFSGTVSLTCSGLPTGYSCAPSNVALNGQGVTGIVTVSPPAAMAALRSEPMRSSCVPIAFSVVGLCGIGLGVRRRTISFSLGSFGALFFACWLSGCSNGPSTPPPYRGTSNFTITGTATQNSLSVSHQISATLTVQ